jgi:rhamnulokinase
MSEAANFLAIDLGASSGRVMLGQLVGTAPEQRIELRELHRFPNVPVQVMGHIHWDVLRLWHEIQTGLARYAAEYDAPLAGIGIDTWAVDFALLDANGQLLGNPYHYRDGRTEGIPEHVDTRIAPRELYAITGIQRLPINTLYQLVSMRRSGDVHLDIANTMLLIPDLFHYWMTGRKVAEYTNATTTQLFDASNSRWAVEIVRELDLPESILPPVVEPGTVLGELLPEVRERAGFKGPVPVIATATHDTASAVAAIPALDDRSVYISSGTWSLVGIEAREPMLTERARVLNFTNEGGVGGVLGERSIRFLSNVGGLWLLQECQRRWEREGQSYGWNELVALAEAASPLRSIVDPDARDFLNPPDMQVAIETYCRRTGQPEPQGVGDVVRACLESLALKYRWVLMCLEELAGHRLDTIRIVGGGSRNQLLCQLTADACDRPVVAGPVEATALGNVMVQSIATGHLQDIAVGRRAVAASIEQTIYRPHPSTGWHDAFARLEQLMSAAEGR